MEHAFYKEELLDLTIGHEIMHDLFHQYHVSLPYGSFKRHFWSGYREHDVIYSWMHQEYISSWVLRPTSPFYNEIVTPTNIWGAPIISPY